MKYILVLNPILFLLMLAGCTTYRVVPDSTDLVWVNGKGFQKVESPSVLLTAAIDQNLPNANRFYVEVLNKSSQPILVAPDQFDLEMRTGSVGAVDPEIVIAQLTTDLQMNEDRAQDNFGDVVNGVADTVAIVSGSETEQQRQDRINRENRRVEEKNQAADQVAVDHAQIETWETQALRKNTIAPGQTVRGFLQFNFNHQPGPLALNMRAQNEPLMLKFNVIKN